MCCPHCVIATSQTTSDQHILVIPPDDTSTDSHVCAELVRYMSVVNNKYHYWNSIHTYIVSIVKEY